MHVCMYACMHVCMHVCMYACMHICMYACMHTCTYACMHACMHVCIHACMHVCMHVCMYACMHVGSAPRGNTRASSSLPDTKCARVENQHKRAGPHPAEMVRQQPSQNPRHSQPPRHWQMGLTTGALSRRSPPSDVVWSGRTLTPCQHGSAEGGWAERDTSESLAHSDSTGKAAPDCKTLIPMSMALEVPLATYEEGGDGTRRSVAC